MTEIFARALLEMGTETEDYVKLSQRIGKSTGGIWGSPVSTTAHGSRENVAKLFLRGKATAAQSAELLDILKMCFLQQSSITRTSQTNCAGGKIGPGIFARAKRTCLRESPLARAVRRNRLDQRPDEWHWLSVCVASTRHRHRQKMACGAGEAGSHA